MSPATSLCGHTRSYRRSTGRLRPAPASDYKHVASQKVQGTLYQYMAMRLIPMQITESPSPQLLNLSPTHMHHRHIDHALTSRTRLWRTPVPNSSHPSVCRCCRRRRRCCSSPWQPNIIPSPYMMSRYHSTFHCLVSSHRIACAGNTIATSHVTHTRDPSIHPSFPRVRYALGIGFGKAGRVVLPSLTLHKLDKAWKNRAWHWVWGIISQGSCVLAR